MKNRVILLALVFLGFRVATQMARAALPAPAPPASRGAHSQNFLGPRLSSDLWNPPAATVNPSTLIPDDSASSLNGFNEHHFESAFDSDSFQLADAFKRDDMPLESAKPIEKIEAHRDSPLYDRPAAVAAPRKGETKRIFLIALASVASLAFRKFRRGAGGLPQKPSFL